MAKLSALHRTTLEHYGEGMAQRSRVLADRIAQGAEQIAALAETLTDAQWSTPVLPDGRKAGVMIHHVASMYPIEVDIARKLGGGESIIGLGWPDIAAINAKHAQDNAGVTKKEAVDLVRQNGKAAAEAIAGFTDEMLDNGGTISLYGNPPLTCQFWIEDHPLRHSWHHVAKIKAGLKL
jgi:hypothetical protein